LKDNKQIFLHLYCTGPKNTSLPTFLLEAGGGACTTSYFAIQGELEKERRVCSYDRAGYGWSLSSIMPRSVPQIINELIKLLDLAGEKGPFVLVGHSVGAQLIQYFAKENPQLVSGLMLIDGGYTDYVKLIAPAYNWTQSDIDAMKRATLEILDITRSVSVLGLMRFVVRTPLYHPPEKRHIHEILYGHNRNWCSQWGDIKGMGDIDDLVANVSIGNLPVVVLSAGMTVNSTCEEAGITPGTKDCEIHLMVCEAYKKSAEKVAHSLSTNGSFIICPTPCSHGVVWEDPDYVIAVIRKYFF